MIFKCKICGGELNVDKGQSTVECEYCGVKQTLPKFFDESTKLMYDRANNYLIHQEFDKAENIFRQILHSDNADSEAYWGLVLCKYGILYVKDPKTKKYIPTCNRTYYSSIFDDENYKNAVKFADEEKAQLYKTNAKTIDDIQRRIISVSKHEKPFDIFISYKETAANGGRTKDSAAAQDLYEKLTLEGYKVFFSRITLEDKIGTEYEPYIYAALASSKVMITVCSSKENIEFVWVRNEWSRFLVFMQKDSTKTLLPLYFDMDKSDLPDEFAHLPSYDIKTDGFEQDLLRGIKKLIPLPIMEKERREKRKKLFKKIGIGAVACLVIAVICMIPWFMKLPDYYAAMQLYYDKNYPEATWAFDELGSYRNAKAMKDKCEKSWRKSLATVVLKADLGRASQGTYYINSDGEIKSFSSDPGSAADNIKIDEHGKIVSISLGFPYLYAMHEDGYVDNISKNNDDSRFQGWDSIVQISPMFNSTNIALKSNGSMMYSNLESTHLHDETDEWLYPILEWNKIVSFDYSVERSSNGSLFWACVAGVQSDGKLKVVLYNNPGCSQKLDFDKEIAYKFHDIRSARTCISTDENNQVQMNIFALSADGNFQIYSNGEFYIQPANNLTDVFLYDGFRELKYYFLKKNGNYVDKSGFSMMEDVVNIQNDFFITRSGMLFDNISFEKCNEKTVVYDEWLERIK